MDTPADQQLCRLPGLYRRWELGQVIEAGSNYRIEEAGTAGDGTPLYSIYHANTEDVSSGEVTP